MSGSARMHQPFAWTQRRKNDGSVTSVFIRISCVECTNFLEHRLHDRLIPQAEEKWFRRQGWSLDRNKATTVVCPACQGKPKVTNVVPLKNMTSPLHPGAGPLQVSRAISTVDKGKELKVTMQEPMSKPSVRPLTIDERAKVRDYLDRFYNEKGHYEQGWSDLKIAQTINAPAQAITILREAAFGPLLGDPETISLQNRIDVLRQDLSIHLGKLGHFESEITIVQSKLDEIKKKYLPS